LRMVLWGGGVSLPVAGGGGYGESASQSAVESKVGRFCVDHGRANILFIPTFHSISRNNLYPPTQTHTHTHTHTYEYTHTCAQTHIHVAYIHARTPACMHTYLVPLNCPPLSFILLPLACCLLLSLLLSPALSLTFSLIHAHTNTHSSSKCPLSAVAWTKQLQVNQMSIWLYSLKHPTTQ